MRRQAIAGLLVAAIAAGGCGTSDVAPERDPPHRADRKDAYAAAVRSDLALGHWGFERREEGVGYVGRVIRGSVGLLGDAVTFRGGGAYVRPRSFSFSGRAPFSLEAWVRPTWVQTLYTRIFSNDAAVGDGRSGYAVWLHRDSGLGFSRYVGPRTEEIVSRAGLLAYRWSHVVATYDGVTMRLYVNGLPVAAGLARSPLPVREPRIWIGREPTGGSQFAGSIDDVAVYGRALSAARVLAHYRIGAAPLAGRERIDGTPLRKWANGQVVPGRCLGFEATDGCEQFEPSGELAFVQPRIAGLYEGDPPAVDALARAAIANRPHPYICRAFRIWEHADELAVLVYLGPEYREWIQGWSDRNAQTSRTFRSTAPFQEPPYRFGPFRSYLCRVNENGVYLINLENEDP